MDHASSEALARANARLACFGVVVREAPGKGRGLFAARPFAVGEVVLRTVPLAIVAMDEWRRNVCARCMHFAWRKHLTVQCGARCGDHYCSETCRDTEAPAHSLRCPMLRAVAAEIARRKKYDEIAATSPYYRSLVRVLALLLCARSLSADCVSTVPDALLGAHVPLFNDCLALEANRVHVDEGRIELMRLVARTVAAAIAAGERGLAHIAMPSEDECVDLLCRESCNSFGYRDDDRELYAFALHPLGAFFNHSCAPNAVRRYHGSAIEFVSERAIGEGEEVTIAYVDVTSCLEIRRSVLSETFLFQCVCARCLQEEKRELAANVSPVAPASAAS